MKKIICVALLFALVFSCCSCGGEDKQYVCNAGDVAKVQIVVLDNFIQGKYSYEYTVKSNIDEIEKFVSRLNSITHTSDEDKAKKIEKDNEVIRIEYNNGDFDLINREAQRFHRDGVNTDGDYIFDKEQFELLISDYSAKVEEAKADEKPLDSFVGEYSNTSIFRRIAFIGDSLSSGEFETVAANGSRGYHDMYEYSWGQYIARKNGLTAYNFSKGGMTAKWYINSFANEKGFWDEDKACQAYVIALGVNDLLGQNMPIGTKDDITAEITDSSPFISYYAEIIRRYKEISPDAKFFFVTFPNEGNHPNIDKFEGMIDALYALAEHFDNSYVIDLYKYGPVYDDAFKAKYFLHGHMNPMGYIYTAKLVDSYIDYIVRTNPDDFKHVGFIGTDIQYK